ncbi:MAG: hypothetical protein R6X25_08220 [Candidatus Krumholzibacteriia bacterium]
MSIQRFRRQSVAAVLALVMAAVLAGCTSREDPSEVLEICGNHSCGVLTMVTTDTTSDGFQYLTPAVSPDGQTLVFTADWDAIPAAGRPPEDDISRRQVLVMPKTAGTQPTTNLPALGAELVKLPDTYTVAIGAAGTRINARDAQKNDPIWVGIDSLIFTIRMTRGNRIVRADISSREVLSSSLDVLYYEPDDRLAGGWTWQHFDPAISPDGRWLAFSRFGCEVPTVPTTCTRQAIWVLDMNTVGSAAPVAFPLTTEIAEIEDPAWSPDGRTLVFSASLDITGLTGGTGLELFTIGFDAGLASTGEVPLNHRLHRITNSPHEFGDPVDTVTRNFGPAYSRDGSEIFFVSTRRAPSVTLRDRNIWRVVADGRLEPEIVFFSREDDTDPAVDPVTGDLVLSSRMGFPESMLDRFEQEAIARIEANEPGLTPAEVAAKARAEREELAFFAGVMSHLFVFSGF